ncbi:hypothetical protein CC86DRAFT_401458 [Ophiobolus disseminans]|uniref:Concanavalin A-like lectin/glucanase n=1 Tax=Ophiobolus disseminans TaxID=1469910 RepID=A0A6A7AHE4_9PLEO|nr:hypothetical protein CC86DRAFT_401458 [Ophiobolus disseminans]
MKTLATLIAVCASTLAVPAEPVAGDKSGLQNYCQTTIMLQEPLPRIDKDPRTWLQLDMWDKDKWMNNPLYHPRWSNREPYDEWQRLGTGEKLGLNLINLTQGNNSMEISWEMTADIDTDYLVFKYKSANGNIWTQFKDTENNIDDT